MEKETAEEIRMGPAFKNNLQTPSFKNTDVYPVATKILGLKYLENIDGGTRLAEEISK